MRKLHKLFLSRTLFALVILGFLSGCLGLATRHKSEIALKDTEILMDFDALTDWQASLDSAGANEGSVRVSGGDKEAQAASAAPPLAKDLPELLLKHGIGSLAFPELHLDDLIERGLASPMSYQDFELALKGGGLVNPSDRAYVAASLFNVAKMELKRPGCYLLFADTKLAHQVASSLGITIGGSSEGESSLSTQPPGAGVDLLLDGRVLYVPLSVRQLRTRSLGFDADTIAGWAAKGFKVWLRPENAAGLTDDQIDLLFKHWKALPSVQGIVFGGALNEALGYPDHLEKVRDRLKEYGWKIGYIELPPRAQQQGIEMLVRALPEQTVRVMAVPPAQQKKLSPERTLGMYSLGARERNIRLLYVRPYDDGNFQNDEDFIFSLSKEVSNIGSAATFKGTSSPGLLETTLMSLGAGALAVLLLQAVGFPLASVAKSTILITPVLGALIFSWLGHPLLFRSLLALCIAMAGPTLAFLYLVYPVVTGEQKTKRSPLIEGARILAMVSLCSLLIGLWVAALLTDTTFLLGLDRFKGVKALTLATPLLIVLCFAAKRYSLSQCWSALKAPVRIYQAALAGVLLAFFGFLMLRTGNDAGAAASDSERYLRLYLDKALGVRPRFKEFLFAHPVMTCLPLVGQHLGFGFTLFFVMVAAIGQAGIVDTFAHVHTPLVITLIRVALGVGLGFAFGLAAFYILKRLIDFFAKVFAKLSES